MLPTDALCKYLIDLSNLPTTKNSVCIKLNLDSIPDFFSICLISWWVMQCSPQSLSLEPESVWPPPTFLITDPNVMLFFTWNRLAVVSQAEKKYTICRLLSLPLISFLFLFSFLRVLSFHNYWGPVILSMEETLASRSSQSQGARRTCKLQGSRTGAMMCMHPSHIELVEKLLLLPEP